MTDQEMTPDKETLRPPRDRDGRFQVFVKPVSDTDTRTCRKCSQTLLIKENFYMDFPNRYRYMCKKCHNDSCDRGRDWFNYRIKKAEYGLSHRKTKNYQAWKKPRAKEYQRQWKANNPHKVIAHRLVRRAIKIGDLIRPSECGRCGKPGRIEASHDDYSKPLSVEWLCPKCHRKKDIGIWIHLIS